MNTSRKQCPICGKPATCAHHPFCSNRCRDRDLLKWLEDGYAIPGDPEPSTPDPES
ncbi:MAG: DNA gyrase inhibitor YacG [Novosphingobium sp.]|nr:DNA gyrase inhibitor YacG [Novosphingobium sp.]